MLSGIWYVSQRPTRSTALFLHPRKRGWYPWTTASLLFTDKMWSARIQPLSTAAMQNWWRRRWQEYKNCKNLEKPVKITMKVPDGSREWAMLAWANSRVSDGQAGMSKERDSADCECWRRLREHQRCGAIGFHEWWCLRQQACPFRYPCQNKRLLYYHADACLFYFYLFDPIYLIFIWFLVVLFLLIKWQSIK